VKNVTFWTGVSEPGRRTRLLSRELIHTALTRSKDRLILLLEGGDSSFLHELIRTSETARRSTNLFAVGIRVEEPSAESGGTLSRDRYAAHLIYRTSRGEMVRSKSELLIAEKGPLATRNDVFSAEPAGQGTIYIGGVADAVAFDGGNNVDVVVDWKSDVEAS
jgi:hypothetical protein